MFKCKCSQISFFKYKCPVWDYSIKKANQLKITDWMRVFYVNSNDSSETSTT